MLHERSSGRWEEMEDIEYGSDYLHGRVLLNEAERHLLQYGIIRDDFHMIKQTGADFDFEVVGKQCQ